jgi:hypothetical protein
LVVYERSSHLVVSNGITGADMNAAEYWKNFNLGEELSVSGTFIYNGLRRFHEMQHLEHSDEIFEILYNLSVGLERLLKIAVVLLEHDDSGDIDALERSLITHNHLELLHRVREKVKLKLSSEHNDFLGLLSTFYKSLRYDRFTLSSAFDPRKEKKAFRAFLSKHLKVQLGDSSSFIATANEPRFQKFIHGLVVKISGELYEVVHDRASELNLYTYELRYGSKAFTVFMGKADIKAESVLWKELLVFFMNSDSDRGIFKHLRSIKALDFDPALAQDYLECFEANAAKASVIDELEHLYSELDDAGTRLEMMDIIGNQNVYFSEDDEDEDLNDLT